jgi:Zn-dependent peptidase ImmA (M78 family)/transcriptional regulator with XRE-family HTH domain
MRPLPNFEPSVNPEMVVLGRESRGLSQTELATALGFSQSKLSKIEGGLLDMSDAEMERISSVLEYPPDFFKQTARVYGPGLGEFFHRRRQDVPQKHLAKIHARISIVLVQIGRLLRSAAVNSNIPKLDIEEYEGRVEHAAQALRTMWMLPRGPVNDLTRVIEDAGGIIVPMDFETKRIDAISRWVPGLPPVFFVNPFVPKDRLRFTLCHELAHLVMHTALHPNIEDEADRFAAEFLAPAEDIRAELDGVDLPKLASLKPYWKLSMAMLLKRAQDLGKVGTRHARTLWTQMGSRGYRLREPPELDVQGEEPSLIYELVDAHRTQLGYSSEDLLGLLAVWERDFRATFLPHQRGGLRVVSVF